MKYLRIRISILFVSICLVVTVLGFAGGIDIASFKKNYTESLVASYRVAGTEPVRKIEYAVKYGKPLTNFYGMRELLSETQKDFPEISDIKVLLPDGSVAYNLNEKEKSKKISESLVTKAFSKDSPNTGSYISTNDSYHIFIPINRSDNKQIGCLDIVLDGSIINGKITNYYNKIIIYLLITALISILLISLLIWVTPVIKGNGAINIKAVTTILITVLVTSQIVFGFINYNLYKRIYIETAKENTSMVVKVVQRDMNTVIQKGAPITELNGIETWLNSIVQSVPEIESLYITDMRGEVFYKTKNLILMQEELIDPMYNYSLPLVKDNMSQKGLINLVLSKKYIENKTYDIALDALTVLLISFIFMTEIIITLMLILKHRELIKVELTKAERDEGELTKLESIRPVAFIFFFAYSLTSSFIPIVMKGFNASLPWISEGLRLSLPVSLEALGTIITTILTGFIIQKKGWKPPFLYGLIIVCIGSVLSGASFNGAMFIIARLITGVGYGLSWMALRGYVTMFSSPTAQTQGFSSLNSGIMSGLNCGIALGAMIADRAGYSFVFYVSVGLLVISAVVSVLLVKNYKKQSDQTEFTQSSIKQDIKTLVRDSKVLLYMILVIVPASICGTFLYYLFPVAGTQMGISSTNIGRAFLLYGLFVVYLGPVFGKYMGSKISLKKSIIAANIVYAMAMLIFGLWVNTGTAFVAVILLGFSDSFGLAAQGSYFLSHDASKKAGGSISLAIYSVFYKLGQMIGPLVFGALIALGIGTGTAIIGIVTVILIAVFIVFGSNKIAKQTYKSLEG